MENETESSSSGNVEWLNAHLDSVRSSIEREATLIAEADHREAVEPRDVARAALRFAPGDRFPPPAHASRLYMGNNWCNVSVGNPRCCVWFARPVPNA